MINFGWFLLILGLVLWVVVAYHYLVKPAASAAHKHLIDDNDEEEDWNDDKWISSI